MIKKNPTENKIPPEEVIIHSSKFDKIIFIITLSVFFCFGVYNLFQDNFVVGIVLFFTTLSLIVFVLKGYNNKEAKIILNKKGIYTVHSGFHKWRLIKNDKIIVKQSGEEGIASYLSFETKYRVFEISIAGLNITAPELNRLLKIYRERNKNKD